MHGTCCCWDKQRAYCQHNRYVGGSVISSALVRGNLQRSLQVFSLCRNYLYAALS